MAQSDARKTDVFLQVKIEIKLEDNNQFESYKFPWGNISCSNMVTGIFENPRPILMLKIRVNITY